MKLDREVVVISGVRTAIGKFGGSPKDMPPSELGSMVVREVLARAGVAGGEIGNVIATEPSRLLNLDPV